MSLTLSDPRQAADIVNAVVDSFEREVMGEDDKTRTEKLRSLETYYSNQIAEERKKRAELERLVESVGSAERDNLSLQQQIQLQQASQVKTEWVRANIQRMKAEADVETLRERLARFQVDPDSPAGAETLFCPDDELQVMMSANPFARARWRSAMRCSSARTAPTP